MNSRIARTARRALVALSLIALPSLATAEEAPEARSLSAAVDSMALPGLEQRLRQRAAAQSAVSDVARAMGVGDALVRRATESSSRRLAAGTSPDR